MTEEPSGPKSRFVLWNDTLEKFFKEPTGQSDPETRGAGGLTREGDITSAHDRAGGGSGSLG